MKIVDASVTAVESIDGEAVMRHIESVARTCYRSEDRIGSQALTNRFVRALIDRGHVSMIEHATVSMRIVCDRGVSHEIVRHRIGSYAQESTRYCCYGKAKFGGEITVIDMRPYLVPEQWPLWISAVENCEHVYMSMLANGDKPEIARCVLPTCLRTEIVVTYNLAQWRHFLRMRCASAAHPQMRDVANKAKNILRAALPIVYTDL